MQSISPVSRFDLPSGADTAFLFFIFPVKLSIAGNRASMSGKQFYPTQILVQGSNGKHGACELGVSIHRLEGTAGRENAKNSFIMN